MSQKKSNKKRLLITFVFLILLLTTYYLLPTAPVFSQSADELKEKIDTKVQDIADLEKEIAKYQKELQSLGNEKASLSKTLKELDLNTKKILDQIKVSQDKIALKNKEIGNLGTEIGDKSVRIENNKEAIADSIRFETYIDESSFVASMISAENISDSWKAIDQSVQFQRSLKEKIALIRDEKADLENTKVETEKAKSDLLKLQTGLIDQKKIVDGTVAEKNRVLKETKNQEASYAKLLAEKIALRDAFEKEMREYESKLDYVLNPSLIPKAGSSPLSWPLDSILVTSPFGPRWGGFHSGTDFRASIGTPVKAMSDGVVDGTGDTDIACKGASFGKFVLVKYDNGLASTFGHLSLIKASKGQTVRRGDIIGYSGNTGSSTGPHLHVSLYARDAVNVLTKPSLSCKGKILTQPIAATSGYLNPMLYLPKL